MKEVNNLDKKLLRLFCRHGGDGEWTKRFEKFPPETREYVSRSAELIDDEKPILLAVRDDQAYLLLTDRRLVEVTKEERNEIPLRDIAHVRVPRRDLRREKKKNWKRLEITVSEDSREYIEVEEGKPYFGFWNALLFVATRNKRPKSTLK